MAKRKSIFKGYVDYLKDNPDGYWFKRKLYGWGWTPATLAGWVVLLIFIAFIVWSGISFSNIKDPSSSDLFIFYTKIVISVIILIIVCFIKGEKPKWTWGRNFRD